MLDPFSRRVVGWAMANHLRSELVLDALEMAVTQRKPRDVIHHSVQGSQYTSLAFGNRCREAGVRLSMGSIGDAYDNAMAESCGFKKPDTLRRAFLRRVGVTPAEYRKRHSTT